MIKAVIFDMFETLITHYRCPLYFGAQMARDAGIDEEVFQSRWRATEHERSVGKMTLEEVIEMILRENHVYSEKLVEKIAGKRTMTKRECFRHLHPEILPMLSGLKEKGCKVGLISNCFSEEAKVIRESELFPYFDGVCLSCEQGVEKPDEEIFRRCMDQLGVKSQECLYIGDGGSWELETARDLGMKAVQAVWYLMEGTTQPVGRKPEFARVEHPLGVLSYLSEPVFENLSKPTPELAKPVPEQLSEPKTEKLQEPESVLLSRFKFRSIRPEEVDQAVVIEQICFPPHEACSEKHMKERIAKAPELFLVAVDKETGKLAGFLNGLSTKEQVFRDEFFLDANLYDPTGECVMLLGLDVLPQYRRQGLGKALVQTYAERERENGRTMLILTCLEEKVEMYRKMGFQDLGLSNSTWGGEAWHEMRLVIG